MIGRQVLSIHLDWESYLFAKRQTTNFILVMKGKRKADLNTLMGSINCDGTRQVRQINCSNTRVLRSSFFAGELLPISCELGLNTFFRKRKLDAAMLAIRLFANSSNTPLSIVRNGVKDNILLSNILTMGKISSKNFLRSSSRTNSSICREQTGESSKTKEKSKTEERSKSDDLSSSERKPLER